MIDFVNVKKLTGIDDEETLLDFADIEEAIRIGLAVPVRTIKGKAILARIEDEETYIYCSADDECHDELFSALPKEGPYVLCVHGDKAMDFARKELKLKENTIYYQYVYPLSEEDISKHMKCAEGYSLEVLRPGEEVFGQVLANYDVIPEEDLRKDFANPAFLGGFTEGEFACFIGLHREGAMGLLRVFPQFRRRGYAEKIYSTLIYQQLKRGALPYCHVDVTNDASIHLQNKLGFVRAQKKLAWMVKED